MQEIIMLFSSEMMTVIMIMRQRTLLSRNSLEAVPNFALCRMHTTNPRDGETWCILVLDLTATLYRSTGVLRKS